jgi:hypothetical protein
MQNPEADTFWRQEKIIVNGNTVQLVKTPYLICQKIKQGSCAKSYNTNSHRARNKLND